ncbi:CRTAC1 family protein [candidate division KSB1 bacterium]|nr:CRTAC1 family protein [candidate division KSB1 bacterium]
MPIHSIQKSLIRIILLLSVVIRVNGQSLDVRINHARIESGEFRWDVELLRSESWIDYGDSTALGDCDLYFHVNPDGFDPIDPQLSRFNSAFTANEKYTFRTGRGRENQIGWIAIDYHPELSSNDYFPEGSWERLLTVSLPILDPDANSELFWDEFATGLSMADRMPILSNLIGSSNGVLTDSSLSFENVTESMLEIVELGSHGACWSDVDEDGYPDLYVTMYLTEDLADRFYLNESGHGFDEQAESRGIDDFDGGSHGATFADMDNDGDYDLINGSTFDSWQSFALSHNNFFENTGSGYFVDRADGIPDVLNSEWDTRAVVTFDMDLDGDLDVFTVTGYKGDDDPAGEKNELFRNDGNWYFTALNDHLLVTAVAGQGATDTDFDGDGDVDLIAANRTGDVCFFRNDGGGQFSEIPAEDLGVTHRAGDGITMGDIDNDGDLDMLLVTGEEHIAHLYRNEGDGQFIHHTTFNGISGYMGAFADLDNNGTLDLVFPQEGPCYLNNGNGNFIEGVDLPLEGITDPRAIAFSDFDLDGNLDFVISDKHSHLSLIRNNSFYLNRWLKVKLSSPNGQAGAFGSKITLFSAGHLGSEILGFREARSQNGYLAQNDPVLHFGLEYNESVDVLVQYPDGQLATRQYVEAGQTIVINQSDILLRMRVLLEGPYNQSTQRMRTDLSDQGLLPLTSPYAQDSRTVTQVPDSTVDWILIGLHSSSDSGPIIERSAFLLSDGTVTDGLTSAVQLSFNLPIGSYYLSVRHRHHLPVMSANPVQLSTDNPVQVDLSAPENLAPGSGIKEIQPGIVALAGGNADVNDSEILASDLAAILIDFPISTLRYALSDINLNGRTDPDDYAIAKANMLTAVYSTLEMP